MTTVSIDDLKQLVRDSEQNHEIQGMDDELPVTAAAARMAQPQPDQTVQLAVSRSWIQRSVQRLWQVISSNLESGS
jgi:hypothetical protein